MRTAEKKIEGEKKQGDQKLSPGSPLRKNRRFRPNTVALHEIQKLSKIYGLPHLEIAICDVGVSDHTTTKRRSTFSGDCPAHLARASRGLCG